MVEGTPSKTYRASVSTDDRRRSPPAPLTSTGTTDQEIEHQFVEEVNKDAKGGIDLRKYGIAEITLTRRRTRFVITVGPDTYFGNAKGRILGKSREILVKYLLWRDGNKCTVKSPKCIMGDSPFSNPLGADIDHIIPTTIGGKAQAENLRLTCHPCNSYLLIYQLKSAIAARTSTGESERESPPRAQAWTSREGEQGEIQQAYWDVWIKREDSDSPWQKLGQLRGGFVRLADLLDLAPREIGRLYTMSKNKFGSSVTYRRYANEDRFSVLEMVKDKGEWWVRFRGEAPRRKPGLEGLHRR